MIDKHIFVERKTIINVWASARGREIEIYRKLAEIILSWQMRGPENYKWFYKNPLCGEDLRTINDSIKILYAENVKEQNL